MLKRANGCLRAVALWLAGPSVFITRLNDFPLGGRARRERCNWRTCGGRTASYNFGLERVTDGASIHTIRSLRVSGAKYNRTIQQSRAVSPMNIQIAFRPQQQQTTRQCKNTTRIEQAKNTVPWKRTTESLLTQPVAGSDSIPIQPVEVGLDLFLGAFSEARLRQHILVLIKNRINLQTRSRRRQWPAHSYRYR